jgi:hypothetical protein
MNLQRPPGHSPLALILDRLEVIIDLLKMSIGSAPSPALASVFPDLSDLFKSGTTPAASARNTMLLLEHMVASSLPSAPQNVRSITVGTTEVLLASNESQALMRVDVHNLNVAQPLLVSKQGVTVNNGMEILAQQTRAFVLPVGASLYGVVNLGTIQVNVSQGYDIFSVLSLNVGGS